jgi:hypothetical protein
MNASKSSLSKLVSEQPELQGKQVVEKLIKTYEKQYAKKYPFEKGQYHQCIPNPLKTEEFITVQLVTRQTQGVPYESVDKSGNFEQMPGLGGAESNL